MYYINKSKTSRKMIRDYEKHNEQKIEHVVENR